MYENKAVATRPFGVGPSNFHTMTSLGSHGACESFNEKGNNFFLTRKIWFQLVLERFESGFAFLSYISYYNEKRIYNVPFNNCNYFELCKSIPDRHPIAKKMIYRMAQKYVRYTNIYLKSRRKRRKNGILSTGTYYKRESNQRACPSIDNS